MEPLLTNPNHQGLCSLFEQCGKTIPDANKVLRYVNMNRSAWMKKGIDRYLRKQETGLPFIIQYSNLKKKVFVHIKRKLNEPKYLGTGYYKHVVYTLDITEMALCVKSVLKLDSFLNKSAAMREYHTLLALQGIPGIPKLEGGMAYRGKDGILRFALITPFCEGRDLYSALYKDEACSPAYPLSQQDKFLILWDVVNTVMQVHQRGICHCDLKIENIFLTWDVELGRWRAIVGDFGGAKQIELLLMDVQGGLFYYPSEKLDSWGIANMFHFMFPEELKNDENLGRIYNGLIDPDAVLRWHVYEAWHPLYDWGASKGWIS